MTKKILKIPASESSAWLAQRLIDYQTIAPADIEATAYTDVQYNRHDDSVVYHAYDDSHPNFNTRLGEPYDPAIDFTQSGALSDNMYFNEDKNGISQYSVLPIGGVFSQVLDVEVTNTKFTGLPQDSIYGYNIDNIYGDYA